MAFGTTVAGQNVGQRHIELAVTQMSPDGRRLTVQAPDSPRVAPPGRYLLFVVDHTRTPSVGVALSIPPSDRP